jgi:uncharacterized protein (DUF2267 family)
MSHRALSTIEHTTEITYAWLDQLSEELGVEDRHYAFNVLRSFLHALRDRLTVEEAAQLATQLPELIRGIYYEGWQPAKTPMIYHDAAAFLARMEQELGRAGHTETSMAADAAARVLRRRVSAGEIDDVLAVLPEPVRALVANA